MSTIAARWIDLGLVAPEIFHATYAALAEAGSPQPALVWGRCGAHVCLGQSQDPAQELNLPLAVAMVQRPLGGGTVWVDEDQYCFALVAPLRAVPEKPAQWFAWALEPMRSTYQAFGLPVERNGRDLWCRGQKIAGSGAATINGHALLASSFLLRFPVERFAACLAGATPGFRVWLSEALRAAMTDWGSHAELPAAADLALTFKQQIEQALSWRFTAARLNADELAARAAILSEKAEWVRGGRLVPNGVKLNAANYLTELHRDGQWVRVLTQNGRIARIALSLALSPEQLQRLIGCVPRPAALRPRLGEMLPAADAAAWAELISNTAYTNSQ